jgi:hypothetical protein
VTRPARWLEFGMLGCRSSQILEQLTVVLDIVEYITGTSGANTAMPSLRRWRALVASRTYVRYG